MLGEKLLLVLLCRNRLIAVKYCVPGQSEGFGADTRNLRKRRDYIEGACFVPFFGVDLDAHVVKR